MTKAAYLNTDLDVESASDVAALTRALQRKKWIVLHSGQQDDGMWCASFEHLWNDQAGPAEAIAAMLDGLDQLAEPASCVWQSCTKRDFNIGLQAGTEPHALEQTLPNDLLARVAAAGASISVTLYRLREED